MIKISVDQKHKRVLIDIQNLDKINKKSIKDSWFDTSELIKKRTKSILDTGERTGTIYRLKGGIKHQASAPGEPPKTRTGALAASFESKVTTWRQLTVGESAEYAKFLEGGTKPMGGQKGARKHLIKAVNETSGDTINILYSRFAKELQK